MTCFLDPVSFYYITFDSILVLVSINSERLPEDLHPLVPSPVTCRWQHHLYFGEER
jgi:hypothetical protein